ncbi:winged helix-turn-helix transcriptional regulator [Lactobacillus rossiae]|uniref:Winged helix-turn-helix transcriptional regulator n=1 Tax=Furfurilactobacillus milii TaxID=2888272 RepID=A0A6N9I1K9_9LACO|nr:winged helix-turn-helix transcriptional regulator [Furfurilactobacillus milii]
MLRLARLYYVEGISQNQLAKREGISKATVSRMLSLARENGFVTITVNDGLRDANVLASQLHELYPEVQFTVVPTFQNNRSTILDKVALSTANYLDDLVKNGDIIGFGSSEALKMIANHLTSKNVRDVVVLSLTGIIANSDCEAFAYETGDKLAHAYQTKASFLPLPVVFDDVAAKELVEKEVLIRHLEKLGRLANIALISLDSIEDSPFLNQMNYFKDEQKQALTEAAVGDVLGHFIDANGAVVDPDLDERVVTTSLNNLKQKEHSIAAVHNVETVPTLKAALNAGYCNQVFIDQYSAQVLLDSHA